MTNRSLAPLMMPFAMALLLALTRSHHVADLIHLPDASWAVFFAAGFYLRGHWAFPALFMLAAAVDYTAITWGGVDSFCVTPAWFFLLPAYGMLFAAGRWYAHRHELSWNALVPFLGSSVGAVLLCELISSGGFYLFSGRFSELTLAAFGERLLAYAPGSLQAAGFWLAVAAVSHTALALASRQSLRATG